MLTGERLLIIEDEFLIALDIQRVIEQAGAKQTVFAHNFEEAAALTARFGEFDLAIISPPRPLSGDQAIADQLNAAGPAVVVCAGSPADLAGTSFEHAEAVEKPFADDELLEACRRALARRRAAR